MEAKYLTDTEFKAELQRCLQCKTKPCEKACPVKCSPHDFIAAAKNSDIKKAAELITEQNPLGEVCGLICPNKFCVQACLRQHVDTPIQIPAVQAEIEHRAREKNLQTAPQATEYNGKKIAVIGLGPSGIGAVSELIKHGFKITVFEKESAIGGAINLIPQTRLPHDIVISEWKLLTQNAPVEVNFDVTITDYSVLLQHGFCAVIVAVGTQKSRTLGIEGESFAIDYTQYLKNPAQYMTFEKVAVVGGGAAAVDCAVTASEQGAKSVEMIVRRNLNNMRINERERTELLEHNIRLTPLMRLTKIVKSGNQLSAYTCKTQLSTDGKLADVPQSETLYNDYGLIILALGSVRSEDLPTSENIFYAGDFINGASTAVEAIASGQKAAQDVIKHFLADTN